MRQWGREERALSYPLSFLFALTDGHSPSPPPTISRVYRNQSLQSILRFDVARKTAEIAQNRK